MAVLLGTVQFLVGHASSKEVSPRGEWTTHHDEQHPLIEQDCQKNPAGSESSGVAGQWDWPWEDWSVCRLYGPSLVEGSSGQHIARVRAWGKFGGVEHPKAALYWLWSAKRWTRAGLGTQEREKMYNTRESKVGRVGRMGRKRGGTEEMVDGGEPASAARAEDSSVHQPTGHCRLTAEHYIWITTFNRTFIK
ncbi:hypothetical protein FB45DRAFT_877261 [Roridomyces roridus]|uniref:Uncharacterized protein n=1 Tax=Roridomyces roridus TaxID=1738132 RepID=A0AAD7B2U6_9AGAR|nr:hypothetical protein FB45DRAFT_877931 [Roridomyces roridus]KAJ7608402.1 hypothetical protein FB45DRAFT_877261 [Roridomyces roridus]